MIDGKDNLDIPEFLKREAPVKAVVTSKELVMSEDDVVEAETDVEAPVAVAKPRKVKAKANGASKPVKKAAPKAAKPVKKAAPKAAKPVKKAAKVAKAAPKAKRASKAPKAAVALDAFGLRAGTLKSKAAAMYATKKGATLAEVKAALGSVQYNVLTLLKGKGYQVTITTDAKGDGVKKLNRYKLSK